MNSLANSCARGTVKSYIFADPKHPANETANCHLRGWEAPTKKGFLHTGTEAPTKKRHLHIGAEAPTKKIEESKHAD